MNTAAHDTYSPVRIGPDRLRDMVDIDSWAFPSSATADEQAASAGATQWGRTSGWETPDGRLAAFHSSYPFARFAVPGGFARAAGVAGVSVHPEHRRRGLLTTMIASHLQHCAERGEALSVLEASEPAIYGRFGYGLASQQLSLTIPRGAPLRDIPDDGLTVRIDHADPSRYLDAVITVQREAAIQAGLIRPGWVQWESPEVAAAQFRDSAALRDGYETLRLVLVQRADGHPVAFAFFRRKPAWTNTDIPHGDVKVGPFAASDPAAAHLLWSRLTDLDLMATTQVAFLAVDDPVMQLLVDQRAAVPKVSDSLWVRLVDLPATLAARQYAAPVDLVFDVTDESLPGNEGRWRLRAEAFSDGARVTRTADEPDVRLDVRELGAIYLGGTGLAALATAGLVQARTPEVLARAASAFSWPLAPTFNWGF